MGPDGSLYIADTNNHRIRRVTPDGNITTFAGTGVAGFSGDGGPATSAQLASPYDLALGPDGSLYIADTSNVRVRRVRPDGMMTTVAGSGTRCDFGTAFLAYYRCGDGGPATSAWLSSVTDIAVGPDGSLYIADYLDVRRVRRVGPNGIITLFAGDGEDGVRGDGGPATSARLGHPYALAVGLDGSIYIGQKDNVRVSRVGLDGIINLFAGNGNYGAGGDGGPTTSATLGHVLGLAVDPDGSVYVSDTTGSVQRVTTALPGIAGEIAIASEDGSELYKFDGTGRHRSTLDALTGVARFTFGYDAADRLRTITGQNNQVTTIERNASGTATAVASHFGQRTILTLGTDDYLASVTNPNNETTNFTYHPGGLLKTRTDPRNGVHAFTYDTLGRLTKDSNPVGGFTALARTDQANGYTVTATNALAHTTTFQVEQLPNGDQRHVTTAPNSAKNTTVIRPDGTRVITDARGVTTTITYAPDPRWGMQAAYVKSVTSTTSDNKTFYTLTANRTATLADLANLLSLQTQTDTVTINGRTTTTKYDATARTITVTDPANQQIVTTLDDKTVKAGTITIYTVKS